MHALIPAGQTPVIENLLGGAKDGPGTIRLRL
jgi:hypothetical protein